MSDLVLAAANDLLPEKPQSPTAPWGWWDLVRVVVFSVLGFIVLFCLLVAVMVVLHLSGGQQDSVLLANSIEIGIYAVIFLAVYWCTVRRYDVPWATLGVRRVSWWWLILVPLCNAIIFSISLGIHHLIGVMQGHPFVNPQMQTVTEGLQLTPAHLISLLLGVAVAAPIGEEIFFRGMLYPLLRRRSPAWLAITLNAAVFAVLHFIPILLPTLFVSGLVLAFVRARTNSILPGILIHMLQNALFVVGVYAVLSGQTH